MQPDGTTDHLSVAFRRKIGLVRLSGDDRNDRDLRLVQGSALDRLLWDKTLRSRLGQKLAENDVNAELNADAKKALFQLDKSFTDQALPSQLGLGLTGGPGLSLNALIGLTASKNCVQLPLTGGQGRGDWRHSKSLLRIRGCVLSSLLTRWSGGSSLTASAI